MADNWSYMKPACQLVYVPNYESYKVGHKSDEWNANISKDIRRSTTKREMLERPLRFGVSLGKACNTGMEEEKSIRHRVSEINKITCKKKKRSTFVWLYLLI